MIFNKVILKQTKIMKTCAPLLTAIACVFSLGAFAQLSSNPDKMGNTQLMADSMSNNEALAVISYHVEEKINMNFGSHVTTYEVSNKSLISTTDLGANNTRTITPKFAKVKVVSEVVSIVPVKVPVETVIPVVPLPAKIDAKAVPERKKYANIDVLETYERVLEKGYKSIDMLTRVANSRYFDGDLVIAAKWYTKLFDMTTNVEPVMYFRYAQSLKADNQIEKSNVMMALFEIKSK
jgi:hypothetical protein